jgi:hypothetical protein
MKTRIRSGMFICATALSLFGFVTRDNAARAAGTEQGGSSPVSCDYSCLTAMVDQYLKALVAHDPSQIAVAEHVKFTENTIPLKLGSALWGTMNGLGTYKLYFADPHDGQVGFEGTIRENGTPAILLLRLRVVNRKISEIEMLVHRNAQDAEALEKFGHPNELWVKPVPASQRTSREEMLKAAKSYFEGLLHSSGEMVPFDPQCNRVLDGYQDTNNSTAKGWFDKGSFKPDAMGIRENMNTGIWSYIKSIHPQRYLVIDEKMGIAFGVFMFNHPGNVKSVDVRGVGNVPMPPITQRPSSVEMGEFFKVEGGKIRQIEGISVALPYGAGTGWDTPAK